MKKITLSEYLAVPENYRGVWTTERWDIPDWENLRKSHMGKRTLMVYDRGTCLLVEGLSLEIVDDTSWKKPEEIKEEIRDKYKEYHAEKGYEPHFLDCIIRWNDTLETLETKIALDKLYVNSCENGVPIQDDTYYLMCSDGLYEELSVKRIRKIIKQNAKKG